MLLRRDLPFYAEFGVQVFNISSITGCSASVVSLAVKTMSKS